MVSIVEESFISTGIALNRKDANMTKDGYSVG